MAIVTLAELKEHLAFTVDLGTLDDALLGRLLAAAENHIDRMLGFKMEAAADDEAEGFEDGVPPALRLAITQLATHWYENREAAGAVAKEMPFGVTEIVDSYREWTF